ncbi:MMPL family transporter [Magnetospirillum sp. 15-1]|uniref:MMPL family transporter n=1 Tax=Magnetospirillum sp. 15-1 TaxID=1979370 RepID=UPI000BBC7543|nr:MMPL family transporter [Magnetospirillum sp. 15-1]
MVRILAVGLVDWCWRRAWAVVIASLAVTVLLGWFAATHLSLDTDESKLISSDLPFRKVEKTIDQAFPHSTDRLAVIIDGPTAELAEDAVERLAQALPAAHKGVVHDAARPAEEVFFRKNGLLFLSTAELSDIVERLVQAQPLLGSIAKDPSLRGLLASVDLVLQGISHGQAQPKDIEPLLAQLDKPAAALAAGQTAKPVDWQGLMSGGPAKDAPRRFLMVRGALDYSELEPASDLIKAVRATARDLGLVPEKGYRVRVTGSLALADANFATVAEGVEISAPLSFLAVLLLLFWGVRSGRVVAAIVISLIVGLVGTAAFASATVGSLNPISVAFAVMFVGIAVDFGIQFVTAYRNERYLKGDAHAAVQGAAAAMAAPLTLAAIATAVGFLSFMPTDYTGVSQLGLIAGGGMIIALIIDFTLLPALLALLKPLPEEEPVGLKLQAADAFLRRHAKPIVVMGCVVGLTGAALLPVMPMDFDPLHLQDPKAEAVSTFLDLARDPDNGVYNMETLAPSVEAATALAEKFSALPEVHRAMTVTTFIPDGQDEKLAMIGDVAMVLGPTLSPAKVLPAPSPEELLAAVTRLAGQLETIAPDHPPSKRLAEHLKAIAAKGPKAAEDYQKAAAAGLPALLSGIRRSLDAEAVSLDTLPAEMKNGWIASDGRRTRVQILPKFDVQDEEQRRRFIAAVSAVTPDVIGAPVSMEESGRVVIRAFAIAAIGAILAIGLLLGLMVRRVLDSVLVLAPLVLGALATVIVARLAGIALNFANVIALPLLLGIGVAFNIYFVVNWRNGVTDHLSSPTTRAVLFSALTTGSAFGSLAVSPHLGTASMGVLLFLSLGITVVSTFVVLPAIFHLIGKPK